MTFIVLLPGAGGAAAYWDRVLPLLAAEGHQPVAVELPADDEAAGLSEYAQIACAACSGASEVLVVAQSMGGFTAPMLTERLLADGRNVLGLVYLNAMLPVPGERPGEWWAAVGAEEARIAAAKAGGWSTEFDVETYFLHDQEQETVEILMQGGRDEVDAAFLAPCTIQAHPPVPTRVIAAADDRFFPLAFQQQVARDRLGLEPVVVPGGHLAALSHPEAVARAILTS